MSVHAAGLTESADRYVWGNLGAATFEAGAAQGFAKITPALREYAIAGTMHMDDLAALADSPRHESLIKRHAAQIAQPLGLSNEEAEIKLNSLLRRHRDEWHGFMKSLGPDTFIRQWAASVS